MNALRNKIFPGTFVSVAILYNVMCSMSVTESLSTGVTKYQLRNIKHCSMLGCGVGHSLPHIGTIALLKQVFLIDRASVYTYHTSAHLLW